MTPWSNSPQGRTFSCTVYGKDDLVFWTTGHAARWLEALLPNLPLKDEEDRMFRAYWLKQLQTARMGLDRGDEP